MDDDMEKLSTKWVLLAVANDVTRGVGSCHFVLVAMQHVARVIHARECLTSARQSRTT
jgi:hypothetical protein